MQSIDGTFRGYFQRDPPLAKIQINITNYDNNSQEHKQESPSLNSSHATAEN